MVDTLKQDLTKTLLSLEAQRDTATPSQVARQLQNFLETLKTSPRWDDSRSATTASFLNLIQDTKENQEYLSYNDLKTRATELLIFVSHKLTPTEAQMLNLQSYQRISTSAETLSAAQRISQSGGMLFETARELPDPLVDEAKRRGGQVQKIGASVADQLRPATSNLKSRFDAEGWTNPLILLTLALVMIFVKNKMLALTIDGIIIYAAVKYEIAVIPKITLPNLF